MQKDDMSLTLLAPDDEGRGISGSLTLGGYDRSRFEANNVSFPIDYGAERDLVVQLDSIGIHSANTSDKPNRTISEPISASIDSAVPEMWLSEGACAKFATELGLSYDDQTNFYTLNSTTHARLAQKNQIFTFRLLPKNSSDFVNVLLPWKAFDLNHFARGSGNETRYFPLRQAKDGRYTLGRVFLQEAYIVVDYESGDFAIHQAKFESQTSDIVALHAPDANNAPLPPSRGDLKLESEVWQVLDPKQIGIIFTAVVVTIVVVLLVIWFVWPRWRRRKTLEHAIEKSTPSDVWNKAELDGIDSRHETGGQFDAPELDAGLRVELPGSEALPQLLESSYRVAEANNDNQIHEIS